MYFLYTVFAFLSFELFNNMTTTFEVRRRRRSFPDDKPNQCAPICPLRLQSPHTDVLNSTTNERTLTTPYENDERSQHYSDRGATNVASTLMIDTLTIGRADLPSFTGSVNDDIESFFKNFEKIANCNNWTTKKMTQVVPITFSKQAEFYYDQLEDYVKKSYQRLKSAMMERFCSAQMRCKKKAELYQLRQEHCESLEAYIIKLEELAFQINLTSEEKLDNFLNGLDDSLRAPTMMKQFKTFEEAISYVTLRDAISPNNKYNENKLLRELSKKLDMLKEEKFIQQPQQINTYACPEFSTADIMHEFDRLQAKIYSLEQTHAFSDKPMQHQNYK